MCSGWNTSLANCLVNKASFGMERDPSEKNNSIDVGHGGWKRALCRQTGLGSGSSSSIYLPVTTT